MTILLFLAVLFVLILVHEWGHFIVAKKTGMRVDEFGIGFPPKLFGIKKGETEYTLNALPIGGFVKIFGENAEDAERDGEEGKDISGSFTSKSKLAQAAVLIAGVTMNVLFAWLLFVIVFMVGLPTAVSQEDATEDAQLVIINVLEGSPAEIAGLSAGVEIISARRGDMVLEVFSPEAFSTFTQESTDVLTVTYRKGGEEKVAEVIPQTGIVVSNPEQPAVGIALSLVENVSLPFHKAIIEATVTTGNALVAITVGIATLIAQSVQGTADFSQVAGPVGIVGLVGDAAEFGLTSLLMFTAVISLNLAVINMLPFPALDGGRLLFVGVEAITKKTIKPVWVARLNLVGFVILIALMVAVTYSDIVKLLK